MLRDQTVPRAGDGQLIEQLLPVSTASSWPWAAVAPTSTAAQGVELVYAELLGALAKAGLDTPRPSGSRSTRGTRKRSCMWKKKR